jgi:hypothetical protein
MKLETLTLLLAPYPARECLSEGGTWMGGSGSDWPFFRFLTLMTLELLYEIRGMEVLVRERSELYDEFLFSRLDNSVHVFSSEIFWVWFG